MKSRIYLLLVLLLSLSVQAKWYQPDYMGGDIAYTENGGIGIKFSGYDYSWSTVALKVGKSLPRRYRFEVAAELGFHEVTSPRDKSGTTFAGTFWLDKDIRIPRSQTDLFLGLGVGLGMISPRENQPLLGDSGVIGLIRGHIGLRYAMNKQFLSLAVLFDHISDPLHEGSGGGDWGRNTMGASVGYGFYFQ